MKKDVLINIRGVWRSEDDRDEIELFTTGTYYKKDGSYYICYNETAATGFEGSKTTLKVDKSDKVTLKRSGKASAQLIVERGVRHHCHYDTGVGDMMIGISGGSIQSDLDDSGGRLMFKYSMDINTLLASENEMVIHVKECNS